MHAVLQLESYSGRFLVYLLLHIVLNDKGVLDSPMESGPLTPPLQFEVHVDTDMGTCI